MRGVRGTNIVRKECVLFCIIFVLICIHIIISFVLRVYSIIVVTQFRYTVVTVVSQKNRRVVLRLQTTELCHSHHLTKILWEIA